MNTQINFATATKAELEAAGYKVTVRKSQLKTRRTKKSIWGVKPSMNNANRGCTPASHATISPKNAGSLQG